MVNNSNEVELLPVLQNTLPTQLETAPLVLYPAGIIDTTLVSYVDGDITSQTQGLNATVTEETTRFWNRTWSMQKLQQMQHKYCGSCRQYVAIVPNQGARLGHYMSEWYC
jgi:hypothetical protein